jgi:hypothetical protein
MTVSLTVPETSTSPAWASAARRARDVDDEATHVAADQLALAAVDPGLTLSPMSARTAHRIAEGRQLDQEAVPDRLDLLAPVARELASEDLAVGRESPATIAELRCASRRVDEVREEDGREHAIGLTVPTLASEDSSTSSRDSPTSPAKLRWSLPESSVNVAWGSF